MKRSASTSFPARTRPGSSNAWPTAHEQDYFERGIELAIEAASKFTRSMISDLFAVEVDFDDDLPGQRTVRESRWPAKPNRSTRPSGAS